MWVLVIILIFKLLLGIFIGINAFFIGNLENIY